MCGSYPQRFCHHLFSLHHLPFSLKALLRQLHGLSAARLTDSSLHAGRMEENGRKMEEKELDSMALIQSLSIEEEQAMTQGLQCPFSKP